MNQESTTRSEPESLGFGRVFTDHVLAMSWTERRRWSAPVVQNRLQATAILPTSAALNYGQGVFEGMKAVRMQDGTVSFFRPDSHLHRLNNGAHRMGIPLVDFNTLWAGLRDLVSTDLPWLSDEPGSAFYLRPLLVGNGSTIGVAPADAYQLIVLLSPLGEYFAESGGADGMVTVMATPQYSRAAPGGTGDIKTPANYGGTLLPALLAHNHGFDQVLWLDAIDQEYVEEIGTMNVFFVIDGVLVTPPLNGRILPGVTRDSVLKLARDEDHEVGQRPVTLTEIIDGIAAGRVTECFGTGTAVGIQPIAAIGVRGSEYVISTHPGPVARRYAEMLAGLQCGALLDRFGWMRRLTEVSAVTA
ncbi:MAG: branched-chain amino acid aminotransferase [Nocardioides sp.]